MQRFLVFQTQSQNGNLMECQIKITLPFTGNKSLFPNPVWMNNSRIRLQFKGSCSQQDKVTFTLNNTVNVFIVYELDRWSNDDFILKDCLFGAVKITKNGDPDKYSYSGYGFGFYFRSVFAIPNFVWAKNAIIFGVDMRSYVVILVIKINIF